MIFLEKATGNPGKIGRIPKKTSPIGFPVGEVVRSWYDKSSLQDEEHAAAIAGND